jgi:hypothetical protein
MTDRQTQECRVWRNFEAIELATLEWADWFNTRDYWHRSETFRRPRPKGATMRKSRSPPWRRDSNEMASGKPGAAQVKALINRFLDQRDAQQAEPVGKQEGTGNA